jgi:hypothetical protein
MNTQPRLQEEQHEPPDYQPVIIEQYRGPLLDQLREQEAEAKLMPLADEPPIAYEDEQPIQLSAAARTLVWLMVRVLNLRDWVSSGWRWLTRPFRSSDTIINWARVGILLQVICVLLWLGSPLIWGLSEYSLTIWFRSAAICFYFAGLFNSARALISYHRSQKPRTVLVLGLIGHILLVYLIMASAGSFG